MSVPLPRSLKLLPASLRKSVEGSARAAAEELKGTGSFVLDVPLTAVPSAKRGLSYLAGRAGQVAETADMRVGEQLARIPVAGKLFQGRKQYPIADVPGGGVIKADIPVERASEPVRKSSRFGVPLLALIGLESLRRPPKEPLPMEVAKKADVGCGHEPMMAQAAEKLAEQGKVIEAAVDKIAHLEFELKVRKLADRMVDKGVIEHEQKAEKVAELMSGKVKIAVVEQALDLGMTPPSIPRLGVVTDVPVPGAPSEFQGDDELNETTLHLLNM